MQMRSLETVCKTEDIKFIGDMRVNEVGQWHQERRNQMSNITTVQRDELFDVSDLERAVEMCDGLKILHTNQFQWFVGSRTANCDFAIQVAGSRNSIGAVVVEPGRCELRGDFENTFMRDGLNRLTRRYDMNRATDAALMKRWTIREVEADRPGWIYQRIEVN